MRDGREGERGRAGERERVVRGGERESKGGRREREGGRWEREGGRLHLSLSSTKVSHLFS